MTELVDLVDATGRIVARAVPRGGPHARGMYVQIVVVIIRDAAGRILVHRRSMAKDVSAGALDHACGAILSGETPEAAARREAREETGVEISELRPVHAGVNVNGRWRHLFAATTDDTPNLALTDPGEVSSLDFVDPLTLARWRADGEHFVSGFFDDLNATQARPPHGLAVVSAGPQ